MKRVSILNNPDKLSNLAMQPENYITQVKLSHK
jgi:hypothetical protein